MTQPTGQAPAFTYSTLDDLAGQTATAVLALWVLRPEIPEAEWVDLLVRALVGAALQAEQWGRLYGQVAEPVDGKAITPVDGVPRRPAPDDFEQRSNQAPRPTPNLDYAARERELTPRITKAVETLAAEVPRPATPADAAVQNLERVERLARDEPIAAAQRGFQDGARIAPTTGNTGYRRGINPDCCELCYWLWKEGYVYPIDQPMHRHTGCRCVPVLTSDPVGRWKLSDDEQTLLDDLYAKYSDPKSSGGS